MAALSRLAVQCDDRHRHFVRFSWPNQLCQSSLQVSKCTSSDREAGGRAGVNKAGDAENERLAGYSRITVSPERGRLGLHLTKERKGHGTRAVMLINGVVDERQLLHYS